MTTTDPDYRALLRNVLHAPADDLPRLVLADWLEERAGTVRCDACRGRGEYSVRERGEYGPNQYLETCLTCNSTGYVSSGNAERAEFLRLQCEIAQLQTLGRTGPTDVDYTPIATRARELTHREGYLWFYSKNGFTEQDTPHIRYTRNRMWLYPCGYIQCSVSRGFVGSIRLTAEQFMQHAAELFREHPITEVVLSGKEPYSWTNHNDGEVEYSWFHYRNEDEDSIQPEIFLDLDEWSSEGINCRNYPTRELALAALSRACVRYGRRLAGLPEEYPQ